MAGRRRTLSSPLSSAPQSKNFRERAPLPIVCLYEPYQLQKKGSRQEDGGQEVGRRWTTSVVHIFLSSIFLSAQASVCSAAMTTDNCQLTTDNSPKKIAPGLGGRGGSPTQAGASLLAPGKEPVIEVASVRGGLGCSGDSGPVGPAPEPDGASHAACPKANHMPRNRRLHSASGDACQTWL
jgi:hypothetical protein